MDFTTSVNAIQQAEARLEDTARQLARPPVATASTSATGPRDTVELSAEAVALLISRNSVEANVDLIKTENGVSRALLSIVS